MSEEFLHHQDRICLYLSSAAVAGNPQIIPATGALIDRIEFVADHASDGTGREHLATTSIKRARVFLAAGVLLCTTSVEAQTAGPEARELSDASLSEEALTVQENRDHLVAAIARYCGKLDEELPQNSPREEEWLQGEIEGGSERQMRAIRSPEWSRRMAANFIYGCKLYSSGYQNDKAIGLAGLAQVFAKYARDLADYEQITNTKFDDLALKGVQYHTRGIAFASLMQVANGK